MKYNKNIAGYALNFDFSYKAGKQITIASPLTTISELLIKAKEVHEKFCSDRYEIRDLAFSLYELNPIFCRSSVERVAMTVIDEAFINNVSLQKKINRCKITDKLKLRSYAKYQTNEGIDIYTYTSIEFEWEVLYFDKMYYSLDALVD